MTIVALWATCYSPLSKLSSILYLQKVCLTSVHNHMVDMINKSGLPVMGVYFGSPSPDHWTSEDILSNKRGFLTEFATVCGQKEPIYARVRSLT